MFFGGVLTIACGRMIQWRALQPVPAVPVENTHQADAHLISRAGSGAEGLARRDADGVNATQSCFINEHEL